ncbi:GntR family transcriptional regulator [Sphingobacterium sp. DN00404]|uniref:GntR family transcriptional regulator n=1 Tax=Sphingobacterium micropteri TaxID=2763501 RepID=A0ABR7YS63_9SPHI|nr:GntR family transcriptional regulator [Sphingobacterium micropteri]MBD1434130.1 GntR family transcriptional regulator [Sphingobacterium micropteri]
MHFNSEKAIYLQITEFVMEKILKKEWLADQKIPSVRDLGGELEVNPNTVMRAYDILQQQEIIYNKRGLGFFVATDAKPSIVALRKKQFIEVELPHFFNTIDLLGISLEEINFYYQKQH